MNNEPVAWMMKAREPSLHCPDYLTFDKPTRDMKISHHPYPIYTHPAKTLTDEEMEIIAEALLMIGFKDDFINYDLKEKAQAILRKAQEK